MFDMLAPARPPFPLQKSPPIQHDGPPLELRNGRNYLCYGDANNVLVFFQNRRLYLANGRMLMPEELASDIFHQVPRELREAVSGDMEKPLPPRGLLGEAVRPMTPEERLNAMDDFTRGVSQPYHDHKHGGVIVRNTLQYGG